MKTEIQLKTKADETTEPFLSLNLKCSIPNFFLMIFALLMTHETNTSVKIDRFVF